MATKVVVEKVNTNTINVIGKTVDSTAFSGDANSREKIRRAFITEEDVEDSMTVRGEGKDTVIRKVTKTDKVEVSVQLLKAEQIADGASLATVVLRNVWTAKSVENEGMTDIFVMTGTNCEALNELLSIASNLAHTDTGARAMGKWYPVANGSRVIIRIVSEIDAKGRVQQPAVENNDCDEINDDDEDASF